MADDLERELDDLLNEDARDADSRASATLDGLIGPLEGRPVILFGAGSLGRKVVRGLQQIGVPPLAIADNDLRKQGQDVDGIPVVSPVEASSRFGRGVVVIVTIYSPGHRYAETAMQLRGLGFENVVPFTALAWKYPEVFLPHWRVSLPSETLASASALRSGLTYLADPASRRLLVAYVRWRLWMDFAGLPAAGDDDYFPDDLITIGSEEVFIDCGAYDGDTLRYFLDKYGPRFSSWIAFEPDPATFKRFVQSLDSLPEPVKDRVDARPYAVGSENSVVRFRADGDMVSAVSQDGSVEVRCVRLDDDLGMISPTYLKLDIEGLELDALRGAGMIIRRARPRIALEVHRLEDLDLIPRFLIATHTDYTFALRSYAGDLCDLVLYALPKP